MANNSIKAAFERMWQHVTLALSNKADNTDLDNYATKSEANSTYATKEEVSNVVIETVALQESNTITNVSNPYFVLAKNKTINDIFMLTFTDSQDILFTAVNSGSNNIMKLTGMGCKVTTGPVFMCSYGNMSFSTRNYGYGDNVETRIYPIIGTNVFLQTNNKVTALPSLTVSNVTVYYK